MTSIDRRIEKLVDYTNICLSTLELAMLSHALLKPLIEDKGLRAKSRTAGASIAHQHLANTLLGSILTEAISISEGKDRTQASLYKVREAIDSPDVFRELKNRWSVIHATTWVGLDDLPSSSLSKRLRDQDAANQLENFEILTDRVKSGYDNLRDSALYKKAKAARDKILAHKDTWRCTQANAWTAEWFDRIGVNFADSWHLCDQLGKVSTDTFLLLTRTSYAIKVIDQESQEIAKRFWGLSNRQCESG